MNDSFRMRLYALTCIAWLAQSVSSNLKDGTLATAPSVTYPPPHTMKSLLRNVPRPMVNPMP